MSNKNVLKIIYTTLSIVLLILLHVEINIDDGVKILIAVGGLFILRFLMVYLRKKYKIYSHPLQYVPFNAFTGGIVVIVGLALYLITKYLDIPNY